MARGTFRGHPNGFGFIKPDRNERELMALLQECGGKDVFVPPFLARSLNDNDTVEFAYQETERGISAIKPCNAIGRNQGQGHGPLEYTVVAVTADCVTFKANTDGALVTASPTSLGITNPILALQRGAVFLKKGKQWSLVRYAPGIAAWIGSAPDITRNPYNFAELPAGSAWEATEPALATHEEERTDRRSGAITVEYEAASPVFVPSHQEPRSFFTCWDGTTHRKAIPGSTMKGAIRTLFEALTASRLGVVSETGAGSQHPPLYRRRGAKLYRVVLLPSNTTPGRVEECRFEYGLQNGSWVSPGGQGPLAPGEMSRSTTMPWHANLYFVPPSDHKHGGGPSKKVKLRFVTTGRSFDLEARAVERFALLKNHPHILAHRQNVQEKSPQEKSGYMLGQHHSPCGRADKFHVPEYNSVRAALHRLNTGDLIHGIDDGTRLICFGKNVNFLWPGMRSPRQNLAGFRPRGASSSQLDGSDLAESIFGFIGDHDGTHHPFRGRVRFGTFWAEKSAVDGSEIVLMPLSSPAGTKLKSRTLHYRPNEKRPSSYDDPGEQLRGRKFYWHQQAREHGKSVVPLPHRHDDLALEGGPPYPKDSGDKASHKDTEEDKKKISAIAIRPLPPPTKFSGEVHFSNLRPEELGALLVALDPSRALATKKDREGIHRFGIKVGKGKPRGLGSLVATQLTLSLLKPAAERYASLEESDVTFPAGQREKTAVNDFVFSYTEWCGTHGNGKFADLTFIKDLRRLTRLPKGDLVRSYPIRFDQYNWLPEFNMKDGSPKGGVFPPPMPLARDDPHEE